MHWRWFRIWTFPLIWNRSDYNRKIDILQSDFWTFGDQTPSSKCTYSRSWMIQWCFSLEMDNRITILMAALKKVVTHRFRVQYPSRTSIKSYHQAPFRNFSKFHMDGSFQKLIGWIGGKLRMMKNDTNMTCQLLNFKIENQFLNLCVCKRVGGKSRKFLDTP